MAEIASPVRKPTEKNHPADWTFFVLAGGKSRRMGRDKSRILINGTSLLDRVKEVARISGRPVKTIRTDAIANCGPLSGIYTGLLRARTRWCLFLGCDMPLLSRSTLDEIIQVGEREERAVFTESEHGFGFPLAVSTEQITAVKSVINDGHRSLFKLAKALKPLAFRLEKNREHELFNANNPEDLAQLTEALKSLDSWSSETL